MNKIFSLKTIDFVKKVVEKYSFQTLKSEENIIQWEIFNLFNRISMDSKSYVLADRIGFTEPVKKAILHLLPMDKEDEFLQSLFDDIKKALVDGNLNDEQLNWNLDFKQEEGIITLVSKNNKILSVEPPKLDGWKKARAVRFRDVKR